MRRTRNRSIRSVILLLLLPTVSLASNSTTTSVTGETELWKDPNQSIEARAHDLLNRLTLEEKVSQILANPPAIPRLGIPAYSHRNECLHGILSGNGTVFPQAIGMAATWDTSLIHQEADVISTEARARHNDYIAKHKGNSGEQIGLNFYSPNINIFRDPRWGRGQETYGEDPFLTAQMGIAFIRGLQGDDPKYVKVMACAKHFAVHSGPENQRHRFNAQPSQRDLYDTYLPAFEAAVREAHVGTFMGAYSSLDGTPDCANPFLLTQLLRNQWGFNGLVFSDGGAIGDIWVAHHFVSNPEQAATAAVKAGCDVSSGGMGQPALVGKSPKADNGLRAGRAFSFLTTAVTTGLISESQVDTAVTRELTLRFRLGMFDPPSLIPWSKIAPDQTNTPEHRALALKVAQESIILLKNDGLLPLDPAKLKRIAVIGPNAASVKMLVGNYTGRPTESVTVLDGIRQLAGEQCRVSYQPGCPLALKNDNSNQPSDQTTTDALSAARDADVVIYVGGLDASLEQEEGRTPYQGFNSGDRTQIELPAPQERLLKALQETGKPIVFVNCSGSAIAIPWEAEHLPAILQAWYPGEQGGLAVAQVLFGKINPAGRLPVTFYNSTKDLPPFENYSMENRTYRYFSGKPLFAFGFGLSYTRFDYSNATLDRNTYVASDTMHLTATLKNMGNIPGEEVVQAYVTSATNPDRLSLCAFARETFSAAESRPITLDIPLARLRRWDELQKKYTIPAGLYRILLAGASCDIRGEVGFRVDQLPR